MPKVRISPTLGDLERSFEEAWGLQTYDSSRHYNQPTVFVGIYGLPDFHVLWKHKGKRWIFWCGSDIRHFIKGYWLDKIGEQRIPARYLAKWIQDNCESWVENEVEREALVEFGIEAQVCPSFVGDINKFVPSFKASDVIKLYSSVSGNDFKTYGWWKLVKLAHGFSDIEFHLYGNTEYFRKAGANIFLHGRISKEQMNEEIKEMTGAIRMTAFDGFSEILAKSVLMAQWPVSLIPYPHMLSPDNLADIREKETPNIDGRNYYLKTLNQYPWIQE